jgi:CheY-like chemotaxis protein
MVVDDEKDNGEMLAVLLQENGHQTLAVGDGPAALEAAETWDPEVILLDLGLPEMDGYEVARLLRERHGNRFLLVA